MRIESRPAFPFASASLRRQAKQKNFLYIFLFARRQNFFQLRKRKCFCFAFLLWQELRKRFPTPFRLRRAGKRAKIPSPTPLFLFARLLSAAGLQIKKVAGEFRKIYLTSNILFLPSKSNDHLFNISLPTKTWSLFDAIALTIKSPRSLKINLTEYIKVCFGIPS